MRDLKVNTSEASLVSGREVSVRLDHKLIAIMLLAVVACTILPLAIATVPVTVYIDPLHPSAYEAFTVYGRFVGYGKGVYWVMYFDVAEVRDGYCVPLHAKTAPFTGYTSDDGHYSALISGQPAGTYSVTVRDDFGDSSDRVCFIIG